MQVAMHLMYSMLYSVSLGFCGYVLFHKFGHIFLKLAFNTLSIDLLKSPYF